MGGWVGGWVEGTFEYFVQVAALEVVFEAGRKAGVHGRTAGQDDVFVVFGPAVHISILVGVGGWVGGGGREGGLNELLDVLGGWMGGWVGGEDDVFVVFGPAVHIGILC